MDTKKAIQIAKKAYEETEGLPEEIRAITYRTFLEKAIEDETPRGQNKVIKETKAKNGKKKAGKKSVKAKTLKPIGDLDLTGSGDKPSLKEFVNEKQPRSNYEYTVVFIYYMQKVLKLDSITYDHIYTCYTEVKRKAPVSMKQNIVDLKGTDKSWIEGLEGDFVVTTRGENFVLYELSERNSASE